MPRKARFSLPGEYFHVIVRGNNKARIFFSKEDRLYFLSLLEDGIIKYKYKIHSYCLMSNHVHLALQVDDVPMSKIVHNIAFRYAKWINARQKRIGHLFQGRYKSIFVASKSQLLELVRYIHFNPVKAKMIKFAENYKWSSHQVYLGRKQISWLTTEVVFNILNPCEKKSLIKYRLLHSAESPKIVEILEYPEEIPMKDFFTYPAKQKVKEVKIDFIELLHFVCGYLSVDESDLIRSSRQRKFSHARGTICWLAKELKLATLTYCANFFNRNESVLKRVTDRLQENVQMKIWLNELKKKARDG